MAVIKLKIVGNLAVPVNSSSKPMSSFFNNCFMDYKGDDL